MRLPVVLFILLLLGQSSILVAEPSQIFVRIFDEAVSESALNGCPPIESRAGHFIPHRFKEPVHEALKSEIAEFYMSHGISCAPPDSSNHRKIQYWTLNALIVSEEDAVPVIKRTLVKLGADSGSRMSFGPESAKRIETLVDGGWLSTERLDYEFSAQATIATSDAKEIFGALGSSNMELANERSTALMMATIPDNHAITFDGEFKKQSRKHPVGIAIQKTDGVTIVTTVQSRDKHLANLVQTAFDPSL